MDLSAFADKHLGSTGGDDLLDAGPFSARIHDVTGSETLTSPLASTVFWQCFLGSGQFASTLQRIGASPLAVYRGEAFIISHGEGWPRHDLIVFDPVRTGEKVLSTGVEASADELKFGWEQFHHQLRGDSDYMAKSVSYIAHLGLTPELAVEAMERQPFGVIVAAPPPLEFTSSPSPACTVRRQTGGSQSSTAGVVAQDRLKRGGITGAFHAVGPVGTTVSVNGAAGTVRSADPITDSAFIECDISAIRTHKGTNGPLKGVTPRAYEPAEFEGAGSGPGRHTTEVVAWSPELPFVQRQSQLKVLTKPDTSPGDSGAALIDGDDHILGFAFYRTGFQSSPAFAAWIWAESVYLALNLD